MEKITIKNIILIIIFLPLIGFGQNFPQGINYQAVARDTNGSVMMNQALTIQFSIISDTTTSAISWQETHPVTTNDYGLFTAVIGQGTSTNIGSSAIFNLIDWEASNHLLKVEIDYGNGYVDMGTTTFMSVPYSLSSKYAAYSNFNPSEPMHIVNKHYVDSIQQGQVISFNTTGLAPDSWITIASVGPKTTQSQKQRADAEFEFTNNMPGAHQRITVRASHIYASGHNLDVIKNVKYGDGSRRQIKAFRIAYGNIYDGGLLQMQLGDNNPVTSYIPINLRVLNNNNDYGWYIDSNLINNTVISDSLPIGYNDGTGNSLFLSGSFKFFPKFFPSDTGVNILDHTPYIGKSSLMYTSDMIHHGSVKRISPVANDNDLTTKQYVDNNKGKSIMPFYNMHLTGPSQYGGTGNSNGVQDNNYMRFSPTFSSTITKTSYFGFGDFNIHSYSRPINSKFHTLEDIIVTGIYLNTPYIDVETFSNSSAAGGLFGFGANTYIDLEIGLPFGGTGYERIFRLGNPSSGDQDLYYFPSANMMSLNPSGIKIVLPESDWILIPAGTNMAKILRFKYYVNDTLWIRNDYNGTFFNYSQINGYLMYITE